MSVFRTIIAWVCAAILGIAVVLLGLVSTLSATVLNPGFVVSGLAGVELHTLVADEIKQALPAGVTFLADMVDEVAPELEPWAHEQLAVIVPAVTGYLQGDSELRAVLSLEEPKRAVRAHTEELLRDSGVADMLGIPTISLEAIVAVVLQELDNRVPDTLVIDESFLDAETLAGLRTARQYAMYVAPLRRALPVVCALAILAIAAVCSLRVNRISRFVGVGAAAAGGVTLVVAAILRSRLHGAVPDGIPDEFLAFLPGFVADCCRPLFLFGGVVLVVGVGLVLLSLNRRGPEAPAE